MKVSIINQSNNESILLSNQDVTVIGRGVFGINDKRISKHHGEIRVLDNQIKIKSCHKNPIYFKTGSDSKDILYQDAEINLNNNDFFSLLPEDFEFQVKIDNDQGESNPVGAAPFRVREITEINDNLETGAVPVTLSQVLRDPPEEESNTAQQVSSSSTSFRKRSIEDENPPDLPKKIKTEPVEDTASTSTSSSANNPTEVQVKPDPDSTNQLPSTSSVNVKQEPDSSNAQGDSSNQPAAAQNIRPSCEHGIRCFRHNLEHRRDFAHPGDNDYRRPDFPQAPPNAPRCPYWAACYRRNPDHFRMFEHPPSSAYDPNQQPPPRPAQAQQPAQVNPPQRRVVVNVFYNDEDDLGDDDEDMFDDFDDTDVDADYEINGDSPSEDENNLEE